MLLGKCRWARWWVEICLLSCSHYLFLWFLRNPRGLRQRRQWHPTLVLLPGKSHGRRSLVDCSPWGREESDMTERIHFHLSLLFIGEGNGNPLQCSCLENPRDGVALSRTRLKWLSSSSSSIGLRQRRQWHPTPVLLPGKSHGQRSLVGCSPWSRWVGHDWATSLSLFTFMNWRRKWQPTPVFLPGESQGQGSLVGCHLWGRTESDTTDST